MIGPPRFYFLRYWREVTWVPNYNYTITTFCNGIAAIGHLRCARVNQWHLNGLCFAFSSCYFQTDIKYPGRFEYKKRAHRLLNLDFCY